MLSNRMDRVNSLIKREVSTIISEKIRDEEIPTIFSIVAVDTTPDLSIANIYFSCIGTEEFKERAISKLKGAAGFIRGEMGKTLKMRKTPYLKFYLDGTNDYGQNIDSILKNISYSEDNED